MNYDILCGNIRLFQVCRILPSPLKNGMVPLDIDVTQFDNSKTHKEGVEGIAMGALSHHERYDGKGYPHGLAGENISLVARIICVSDSFDAMNSHRCYRSSLPTEVIFNELLSNKGTQFDPKVIDCLLSIRRRCDYGNGQ